LQETATVSGDGKPSRSIQHLLALRRETTTPRRVADLPNQLAQHETFAVPAPPRKTGPGYDWKPVGEGSRCSHPHGMNGFGCQTRDDIRQSLLAVGQFPFTFKSSRVETCGMLVEVQVAALLRDA